MSESSINTGNDYYHYLNLIYTYTNNHLKIKKT